MIIFILIIALLLFISIILIKKTSLQEYGIAGILVALTLIGIFMLYLLFR